MNFSALICQRVFFVLLIILTFSNDIISQKWIQFPIGIPKNWINIGDLDVSGDAITVEALISVSNIAISPAKNIVSKHTGFINCNYLLRHWQFEITTTSGYKFVPNPVTLCVDSIYHVAGTYDGDSIKYYLNGLKVASVHWTGDLVQNSLDAAIGNISGSSVNEQFFGYIDEVRIWNTARTQTEIANYMYNLPNPTSQSGLKAYYKFEGNYLNLQGNSLYNGTLMGSQVNNIVNPFFRGTFSNPPANIGITISASNNPACSGDPVTFTAVPTNPGSSPVYQWKVNGLNVGLNNPVYTYVPVNGNIITCRLTSNIGCTTNNPATSNAITMSVTNSVPVNVSISVTQNNVCEGTSVTFNATPTNGGATPAYQWQVNGMTVGSNLSSFTYIPLNGDIVKCILTSSLSNCITNNPATSNAITMSVVQNSPVGITITASQNPVCTGIAVSFTALPTNPGSSPVYQWKVNGANVGINNPNYTYVPSNGDIVTCRLTSNIVCTTNNPATSNSIIMIVNNVLTVNVSILASQNTVCQGSPVTFNATPSNGGSSPIYQWKVNGLAAGSNAPFYTYIPMNGDVVTCILTSSLSNCITNNPATSNAITMNVFQYIPVGVTITSSQNPVCEGNMVTYTALATNPGSSPVYQWQVNGINVGINNMSYSYIPANGDVIKCILTSSLTSCVINNPAVSNLITMVVNTNNPVSVTIAVSQNPVCENTSVNFVASSINPGSSPDYQWEVNGIIGGLNSPNFNYIPSNGDVVKCILTSSLTICTLNNPASSNLITMVVNPLNYIAVSISASANPVCQGAEVSFTAIPINPGSSPVFQWKVNGLNYGPNNSYLTYNPLNSDVVTCEMTSSLNTCVVNNPALSNSISMTVNSNNPVNISIAASSTSVCAGTEVIYTSNATNPGNNPEYQWQVNNLNIGTNNPTFSYIPANGDMINCILISSLTNCVSNNPALSNTLSMTVNPLLPVEISILESANNICEGTWVTFNASATNIGNAPVYSWNINGTVSGTNANSFSYYPINNDVVSCSVISSLTTCVINNPAISNLVTMTVNQNLPVSVSIISASNPICKGLLDAFTAVPENQGNDPVYKWNVNGMNVGSNNPVFSYFPEDNDILTCELISSLACTTGNPFISPPLLIKVNPVPSMKFTICFDTCTIENAKPFLLKGGTPIGGVYSGTGVNSVNGYFDPSKAVVGMNEITYAYTNIYNCTGTQTLTINVNEAQPFSCGQLLTDIRDGQTYPTILLGTQCWMRTNLDYGIHISGKNSQYDNCQTEKYCFNNESTNCSFFGALYQWDELMQYQQSPGVQGLCPPGWHIPTKNEWSVLFSLFKQQALAGEPLQDNVVVGFNALQGGVYYSNMKWQFKNFATIFWTSDYSGTYKAISHGMNLINFSVSDYKSDRYNAFSARCLKD